jgi:cellulose synthase/poly-beta-1,6-N-acetylglucosamine synthase-like glycosyltransferase
MFAADVLDTNFALFAKPLGGNNIVLDLNESRLSTLLLSPVRTNSSVQKMCAIGW